VTRFMGNSLLLYELQKHPTPLKLSNSRVAITFYRLAKHSILFICFFLRVLPKQ